MSTRDGWFTSSFSDSSNCVQIRLHGGASVRDSKDPTGPTLHFTTSEWLAFVQGVRNGEFDLLLPPGDTHAA